MRNNIKQRGVTLIEVLAVVIIGVILLVGAFALYTTSQEKKLEKDTVSTIGALRLLIQDSYSGTGGYEGLDDQTLIQMVDLPSTLREDRGIIIHPLGGQLSVMGNEYGFAIALAGLSQENCVSLGNRRSISDSVIMGGEDNINLSPTDVVGYCASGNQDRAVIYVFASNVNRFLNETLQPR